MCPTVTTVLSLLAVPPEIAPPPRPVLPPAEQVAALRARWSAAQREWEAAGSRLELKETDPPPIRKQKQVGLGVAITKLQAVDQEVTAKLEKLFTDFPTDPAVVDAIELYLETVSGRMARSDRHVSLLANHLAHPSLGRLIGRLTPSPEVIDFYRRVAADAADRTARGRALFLVGTADKRKYVSHYWPDKEWTDPPPARRLPPADELSALRYRAESALERAAREYADVRLVDTGWLVGRRATEELAGLASADKIRPGAVPPDLVGEDIDGKPFKLSDYRGRVVLLTFSGNWCGPCRGWYPHYRALVERLKGRPFALLEVNTDRDREQVQRRTREERLDWRKVWNGGDTFGRHAAGWNVEAFPALFLLDHAGVIRIINQRDDDKLDAAIDGLVRAAEAAGNPKQE